MKTFLHFPTCLILLTISILLVFYQKFNALRLDKSNKNIHLEEKLAYAHLTAPLYVTSLYAFPLHTFFYTFPNINFIIFGKIKLSTISKGYWKMKQLSITCIERKIGEMDGSEDKKKEKKELSLNEISCILRSGKELNIDEISSKVKSNVHFINDVNKKNEKEKGELNINVISSKLNTIDDKRNNINSNDGSKKREFVIDEISSALTKGIHFSNNTNRNNKNKKEKELIVVQNIKNNILDRIYMIFRGIINISAFFQIFKIFGSNVDSMRVYHRNTMRKIFENIKLDQLLAHISISLKTSQTVNIPVDPTKNLTIDVSLLQPNFSIETMSIHSAYIAKTWATVDSPVSMSHYSYTDRAIVFTFEGRIMMVLLHEIIMNVFVDERMIFGPRHLKSSVLYGFSNFNEFQKSFYDNLIVILPVMKKHFKDIYNLFQKHEKLISFGDKKFLIDKVAMEFIKDIFFSSRFKIRGSFFRYVPLKVLFQHTTLFFTIEHDSNLRDINLNLGVNVDKKSFFFTLVGCSVEESEILENRAKLHINKKKNDDNRNVNNNNSNINNNGSKNDANQNSSNNNNANDNKEESDKGNCQDINKDKDNSNDNHKDNKKNIGNQTTTLMTYNDSNRTDIEEFCQDNLSTIKGNIKLKKDDILNDVQKSFYNIPNLPVVKIYSFFCYDFPNILHSDTLSNTTFNDILSTVNDDQTTLINDSASCFKEQNVGLLYRVKRKKKKKREIKKSDRVLLSMLRHFYMYVDRGKLTILLKSNKLTKIDELLFTDLLSAKITNLHVSCQVNSGSIKKIKKIEIGVNGLCKKLNEIINKKESLSKKKALDELQMLKWIKNLSKKSDYKKKTKRKNSYRKNGCYCDLLSLCRIFMLNYSTAADKSIYNTISNDEDENKRRKYKINNNTSDSDSSWDCGRNKKNAISYQVMVKNNNNTHDKYKKTYDKNKKNIKTNIIDDIGSDTDSNYKKKISSENCEGIKPNHICTIDCGNNIYDSGYDGDYDYDSDYSNESEKIEKNDNHKKTGSNNRTNHFKKHNNHCNCHYNNNHGRNHNNCNNNNYTHNHNNNLQSNHNDNSHHNHSKNIDNDKESSSDSNVGSSDITDSTEEEISSSSINKHEGSNDENRISSSEDTKCSKKRKRKNSQARKNLSKRRRYDTRYSTRLVDKKKPYLSKAYIKKNTVIRKNDYIKNLCLSSWNTNKNLFEICNKRKLNKIFPTVPCEKRKSVKLENSASFISNEKDYLFEEDSSNGLDAFENRYKDYNNADNHQQYTTYVATVFGNILNDEYKKVYDSDASVILEQIKLFEKTKRKFQKNLKKEKKTNAEHNLYEENKAQEKIKYKIKKYYVKFVCLSESYIVTNLKKMLIALEKKLNLYLSSQKNYKRAEKKKKNENSLTIWHNSWESSHAGSTQSAKSDYQQEILETFNYANATDVEPTYSNQIQSDTFRVQNTRFSVPHSWCADFLNRDNGMGLNMREINQAIDRAYMQLNSCSLNYQNSQKNEDQPHNSRMARRSTPCEINIPQLITAINFNRMHNFCFIRNEPSEPCAVVVYIEADTDSSENETDNVNKSEKTLQTIRETVETLIIEREGCDMSWPHEYVGDDNLPNQRTYDFMYGVNSNIEKDEIFSLHPVVTVYIRNNSMDEEGNNSLINRYHQKLIQNMNCCELSNRLNNRENNNNMSGNGNNNANNNCENENIEIMNNGSMYSGNINDDKNNDMTFPVYVNFDDPFKSTDKSYILQIHDKDDVEVNFELAEMRNSSKHYTLHIAFQPFLNAISVREKSQKNNIEINSKIYKMSKPRLLDELLIGIIEKPLQGETQKPQVTWSPIKLLPFYEKTAHLLIRKNKNIHPDTLLGDACENKNLREQKIWKPYFNTFNEVLCCKENNSRGDCFYQSIKDILEQDKITISYVLKDIENVEYIDVCDNYEDAEEDPFNASGPTFTQRVRLFMLYYFSKLRRPSDQNDHFTVVDIRYMTAFHSIGYFPKYDGPKHFQKSSFLISLETAMALEDMEWNLQHNRILQYPITRHFSPQNLLHVYGYRDYQLKNKREAYKNEKHQVSNKVTRLCCHAHTKKVRKLLKHPKLLERYFLMNEDAKNIKKCGKHHDYGKVIEDTILSTKDEMHNSEISDDDGSYETYCYYTNKRVGLRMPLIHRILKNNLKEVMLKCESDYRKYKKKKRKQKKRKPKLHKQYVTIEDTERALQFHNNNMKNKILGSNYNSDTSFYVECDSNETKSCHSSSAESLPCHEKEPKIFLPITNDVINLIYDGNSLSSFDPMSIYMNDDSFDSILRDVDKYNFRKYEIIYIKFVSLSANHITFQQLLELADYDHIEALKGDKHRIVIRSNYFDVFPQRGSVFLYYDEECVTNLLRDVEGKRAHYHEDIMAVVIDSTYLKNIINPKNKKITRSFLFSRDKEYISYDSIKTNDWHITIDKKLFKNNTIRNKAATLFYERTRLGNAHWADETDILGFKEMFQIGLIIFKSGQPEIIISQDILKYKLYVFLHYIEEFHYEQAVHIKMHKNDFFQIRSSETLKNMPYSILNLIRKAAHKLGLQIKNKR